MTKSINLFIRIKVSSQLQKVYLADVKKIKKLFKRSLPNPPTFETKDE